MCICERVTSLAPYMAKVYMLRLIVSVVCCVSKPLFEQRTTASEIKEHVSRCEQCYRDVFNNILNSIAWSLSSYRQRR